MIDDIDTNKCSSWTLAKTVPALFISDYRRVRRETVIFVDLTKGLKSENSDASNNFGRQLGWTIQAKGMQVGTYRNCSRVTELSDIRTKMWTRLVAFHELSDSYRWTGTTTTKRRETPCDSERGENNCNHTLQTRTNANECSSSRCSPNVNIFH
jgi:hypothetical protein